MKAKTRVLIIAYYWPPAGGPGVQRWLKFVKYLPELGIEPVLYVPDGAHYPLRDEKGLTEVPDGIEILRGPIWEPYGLAGRFSKKDTQKISAGLMPKAQSQSTLQKIMLWIRGNVFIPDARRGWVGPSVRRLRHYVAQHPVEAIITTGPPHSVHLIGLGLQQHTGLPWLADFRDPWTTIGYHQALRLSAYAANRHKKLEKKVLHSADRILVTSPTTAAEFAQITPRPIEVITNGYDSEPVPPAPLDSKFSIAHIGSLLSDRNPQVLWESLRDLINIEPGFAEAFQLKLIGAVSPEVMHSIEAHGLLPYVWAPGYVPHHEALLQQRTSQVLLLIEIDQPETRCILPGKLFEYMVSGRPILALGPEGSDMIDLLTRTNTGRFYTYQSAQQTLVQQLRDWFAQYQAGTLQSHGIGLQPYHRKALTAQLAQLIQQRLVNQSAD